MTTTILWFRRDLRLSDNPALVEAVRSADEVVGLFVFDPALWGPAGANRRAYLVACLRALDESMGGRLVVRSGEPSDVVPTVAAEVDAAEVHIAADFGPYGRRRDEAVAAALEGDGRTLVRTGSPYAIEPDTIFTKTGTPYKVFTPFFRAWTSHGYPDPVRKPSAIPWAALDGDALPEVDADADLPRAGEDAASNRVDHFLSAKVEGYDDDRNDPGADATSRLSADLKWGVLHPRQLLARLGRTKGEDVFRSELAWREFYADVLFHWPESRDEAFNDSMKAMEWDTGADASERFERWAAGETGYPIVDAGMRQLLAEGWMHNRVRMITASFLVKDLHVPWQWGARHFMRHLVDGDLASNQHGWQWTAGTGTDAAPFFRIFNPVSQGKRFDPEGTYVRRYVDELANVPVKYVHEPWKNPDGLPIGYTPPIVDHGDEREVALARYQATRR